mmetsp:Transcript_9492/g.15549  ORF Transcript_9492/g.15549 Transcript_9492/m.15549 type:complete len:133 (-) Transcript_9492:588-986(-)
MKCSPKLNTLLFKLLLIRSSTNSTNLCECFLMEMSNFGICHFTAFTTHTRQTCLPGSLLETTKIHWRKFWRKLKKPPLKLTFCLGKRSTWKKKEKPSSKYFFVLISCENGRRLQFILKTFVLINSKVCTTTT